MDIVFKTLGFLSIPLLIISIILMVRSLKKERTITIRSLFLQVIIGIVLLITYATLLNINPPTAWSGALIGIGLLIGGLQSRTIALTVREKSVLGKRPVWFLVIWGISFTITQLLALFGRGDIASYGLLTIYLSTGLTVGANMGLFFRRQQSIRRGKTSGADVCPSCGTAIHSGKRFCTGCGNELASVTIQPATCSACGSEVSPGKRFCTGCGVPLNK